MSWAEANVQIEQLDQRSTQAGEQLQSIGRALQSGANQLRSEGKDVPARVVEEVARRADDVAVTSSPRRPTGSSATSRDSPERVPGSRRAWAPSRIPGLTVRRASGNRRYESAHSNGSDYSPSMRSLTSGGA